MSCDKIIEMYTYTISRLFINGLLREHLQNWHTLLIWWTAYHNGKRAIETINQSSILNVFVPMKHR